MKTFVGRVLCGVLATTMAAGLLLAGEFHSQVIASGSSLFINVNDEHSLRIWNFTQQGGTQRGVVTVTTSAGTTNVLTASIIDTSPLEPINQVVIAGPAQVTVTPGDAMLFITYRKQLDDESGTPSSTSTPTPTPTP